MDLIFDLNVIRCDAYQNKKLPEIIWQLFNQT
jgi:hypothetical protein